MLKVFLGGTTNKSDWRGRLIPLLNHDVEYFNPVVEDWTEECKAAEIWERENSDYCLYVITPKIMLYYSIAEVVDDSNKRPEQTIFCVVWDDDGVKFNKDQESSMLSVLKMVDNNGAIVCTSLESVASLLNAMAILDKDIITDRNFRQGCHKMLVHNIYKSS